MASLGLPLANTTNLALPWAAEYVRSFRHRLRQHTECMVSRPVSRVRPTSCPQRLADHSLPPPTGGRPPGAMAINPDHHVCGDTGSCLAANSGCNAFQRIPSTAQQPCLRASCTVANVRKGVFKGADGATHEKGASKRDRGDVGKHVKGTLDRGPPCDLNNACSDRESLGLTLPPTNSP